jgi:hypothetical protein
MRLEPFCTISMRYSEGSWYWPYGSRAGDEEALGFGHGDGTVTGEIEGGVVWSNYPRRRQDGVWTPNLRGRIALSDGDAVLVSIHGQSVQEHAPGNRRAILVRLELTTEAARYRWLNTCFLVGEGRDRRGARELVAGDVRLRERAGAGPAGARSATARAVPSDQESVLAAAAPTSARVTSTIASRSATAMCSSGVWISAMPLPRLRHERPRALKTFASAPPPESA